MAKSFRRQRTQKRKDGMKSIKTNHVGRKIALTTFASFLFLGGQPVFANSDPCCANKTEAVDINRGYLSTPRAREEYPWLTRGGTALVAGKLAKPVTVTANRALAKSPRYLEEHPELLRPAGTYVLSAGGLRPPEITKNTAWAASPRVREEFPALRRVSPSPNGDNKVQIAPLK